MVVLLIAALGSGLTVLALTWSSLGPWALHLAPAVASAASLLAGLTLALLRRDKSAAKALRIGVSDATSSERAAYDASLPQQRAS
jgi:hypothetical protein